MIQLVTSLVISRIDHCNSVLAGLPASTISYLQGAQNAAARLIFDLNRQSHVTPLLRIIFPSCNDRAQHFPSPFRSVPQRSRHLLYQRFSATSTTTIDGQIRRCLSNKNQFDERAFSVYASMVQM